jgi:hypothetical protein
MKLASWVLILLATLAVNASPNDLDGTWRAVFVGPMGPQPKMVSEMVFNLKVSGKQLTGMAHMASWPGDAPISDGKIDGDHISFVTVGKLPWASSGQGGASSGYPRLKLDGTIHGNDMKLTLIWDSVMIYGEQPESSKLEMEGKKISEAR